MSESSLVLLVSDNAANVQAVRAALEISGGQFSVQHIERVRTAAARIAGGGVTRVLLDISGGAAESEKRDAFLALRAASREIPLIVLCDVEDQGLAAHMVREGATTHILRPNWQADLLKQVLAAAVRSPAGDHAVTRNERRASIISVMGAKGGVGVTTTAVNVASALAATSRVVVAELRPSFGTLCHFFRPHRTTRTLQNILVAGQNVLGQEDVESCLWPNRSIPGMSVLFAPDTGSKPVEMGSEQAREILRRLSEACDVVVVDLPPSLSETERAIISESDTFVLAVERDALSVDAAKTKLSALEAADIAPHESGLVIVNRVALAAPLALSDIESQLGLPTFAVIPPAADLCAAAYRAHTPVVKLDAQSSLATSLLNLAKRLSSSV